MAVAVVLALLILSVAAPASFAKQYVVGGSSGWMLGVNYTAWASGQTYIVGDTLLFTYDSTHTVDVVSQSDYNNCNINSPKKSYNNGSTVIPLTSAGPMYFICGTPGHCQGGMLFSVTVSAAGSQSPPPTSAAPSGSLSPPPTPPPASAAPSGSPPPPPPASAAPSGSLSPPPPPPPASAAPSGSLSSPPPPPPSAATTAIFGGKMSLLLEFSLLVVAFVGFTA